MKSKNTDRTFKIWFRAIAILTIGIIGLGVWGFIELINWITTK